MPIFSKPNAIVYVRRSGVIIAGKKLTPARYNFPVEHIENLEILDEYAFTESLQSFFTEHSMKGKHVLMVLDDSVVFIKPVKIDGDHAKDQKPAHIADAFIEQMPLSPGQRACLRVLQPQNHTLYGTNGDLFKAIAAALDGAGVSKVLAITPAAAYSSENGKQQLATAVQQYISDTNVRTIANFQNVALV